MLQGIGRQINRTELICTPKKTNTQINNKEINSLPFNNNYVIAFLGKKDYTENEKEFFYFKKQFSSKLHKLATEENISRWNFYINSTEENEKKNALAADNYIKTSDDPKILERLNKFKEAGVTDPIIKKSLDDLITEQTNKMMPADDLRKIEDKENEISLKVNNCRGKINGKSISNVQLNQMLKNEKNVEFRKKLYKELKVKAPDLIANDLVELVKARNTYAQKRGYNDFFSFQLKETFNTSEEKLFSILDTLENETNSIYKAINDKNDAMLSNAFGITPEELRPHHYGLIFEGNPFKEADKYVIDNDTMIKSTLSMYENMGWNIQKLPIQLDIFPKENKSQHAFCLDVDTNKDVRIIANLTNDINSIESLSHELGHAVYNIGVSEHLPYFQRDFSSFAMTESVAMLMQSLPYKEGAFEKHLGMPRELAQRLNSRNQEGLVNYIRQCLVYLHFEKQMYANPNQDMQKLWYGLEKKFLNRNIPEKLDNRWASVPHFLTHPAYYQNYLRAEIMASQIYDAATEKLGPLTKNKNTAEFFRKKLFRVGLTLTEDELIKKITGKELSVESILNQIKAVGKSVL